MTGDVELIRSIVANCRNELDALTEAGSIKNHAAEDEINDALDHLDAALVDIDAAMNNEEN